MSILSYSRIVVLFVSVALTIQLYFFWSLEKLPSAESGNVEISLNKNSIDAYLKAGALQLKRGWASPEDWGVWALGDRATISILLSRGQKPKYLYLKIRPLVGHFLSSQEFDIFIDQKFSKHVVVSKEEELILPLQPERLGFNDAIEIDFHLQSRRPKDLGLSSDDRLLSIGLISVKLE